jgi:hypothetical protein
MPTVSKKIGKSNLMRKSESQGLYKVKSNRLLMMMVWGGKLSSDCKITLCSKTTLRTKMNLRQSATLHFSKTTFKLEPMMKSSKTLILTLSKGEHNLKIHFLKRKRRTP